jgi:hypothetical protein
MKTEERKDMEGYGRSEGWKEGNERIPALLPCFKKGVVLVHLTVQGRKEGR